MERKERTGMISLRVPEGLLKRIENDVETNGDHASRADWIIAAIREYEQQRTKLMAQRKIASSDHEETIIGSADNSASQENHANL